ISDQFHATLGDGAMVQGGSRGRNIKAQGAPTDASTSSNPASTRAPWATFYSSPVHIISKPSKKSTRGATPNILNLNSVALFNRINSQTVRTKYLSYRREGNAASSGGGPSNNLHINGSAENGLTTSSSHWSPFIISLVPPNSHNAPVRFGARVRLSSPDNSYVSHEYIIRKVENKRSLETDFGTQRPGPEPITVIPGSTHSTSWRWAEVKTEVAEDGTSSELMVYGAAQFQYTFFDATGSNTVPPRVPLTPAPKLNYPPRWIHPIQTGGEHSLEMSITHFYSSTPPGQLPAVPSANTPSTVHPAATNSSAKQSLQIWIGDLGPLKTNSYEGLLTNHDGLTQSGFVFPVLPPFGLHHDPSQGQAGMIAPTTLHPSLPGIGGHGNLDVPLPLAMPMTIPIGQAPPSLASPVVNIHNSMTGEMLRTPVLTAFPPGEFHYVAGGTPNATPLGGNVSAQGQTHGVGTLRDPAPSTFVAAFLPDMNDLIRALLDSVRTPTQRADFSNATGTILSGRASGDMDVDPERSSRLQGELDEREEDDTVMGVGLVETDEELWARNPALPILLIRPTDGMGFHSGYVVKCVPAQGHGLDNVSGWSIKIEKAELGGL
ncbi:6750_t:CDS:2, partial [Acaulospora colombiana]